MNRAETTGGGAMPATIGPYQLEREVGRGGMGVVYLANDSRLGRAVAIKALPDYLADDPAMLARFQREAKVLASISHANIAGLYGLEESGGRRYLVLEYVEGETLAERLERGALHLDEALAVCAGIAAAIEAAHEAGVIHRDLKPGNVKVREDGGQTRVKVLDFGLAREVESRKTRTQMAEAETVRRERTSMTQPGSVMGTPGFMSPEQCRGKALDKRTDIWSLGCVLYECLTGAQAFGGETASDANAAILEREPDWSRLPARTPVRVRELLRHCLEKDARNRLRDAGDARLELERALAGREWTTTGMMAAAGGGVRSWKRTARVGLASLLLVGLGAGAAWFSLGQRGPTAPVQPFHVSAAIPSKPSFGQLVGISPDARFVVYTAWPDLGPDSEKPAGVLMVRRLDRDETKVIDGTEGARTGALSADGRWVAFSCTKDRAGTKLVMKKVGLADGQPTGPSVPLCELAGGWPSLCWASDREIVFSEWTPEPALFAVPAEGGEPRVVLREESKKNIEGWDSLAPLPGGKSILATRGMLVEKSFKLQIEVVDLATGTRTLVLPNASSAKYLAEGYVLAIRNQNTLVATRYDIGKQQVIGSPVAVLSRTGFGGFDASRNGTLAFVNQAVGTASRRLAWVDDKGQTQPIPGVARAFEAFAVSPDGGRVVCTVAAPDQSELPSELVVLDLGRRTSSRLPTQGAPFAGGIWSKDGQRITYGTFGGDESSVWERRADGAGEIVKMHSVPGSRAFQFALTWSPDGKVLSLAHQNLGSNNGDIWLLERGDDSKEWAARPYLDSKANESGFLLSPDGKWALVTSDESGRTELYAQRFTGKGSGADDARAGRWQISTSGCGGFWWGGDGKEIRFMDWDSQVMSVQVKTEPEFSASLPTALYSIKDLKTYGANFAPDGRVMVVLQGEGEQVTKIDLVVNFLEELKARMAAAK